MAATLRRERVASNSSLDTGAVVAASTDATGASSLGANWVLERSTAAVDVAALAISSHDGELAAGTTLAIGGNTTTTYQDVGAGLVLLSNGGKAVAYLNQVNGDLVTYCPYGPLFDGVILVMDANNYVVKTVDFKRNFLLRRLSIS
jgi:hypothetical protein